MTHPDSRVQEIADRYGATVSPDLRIQRFAPGESAFGLVWDGSALVAADPGRRGWTGAEGLRAGGKRRGYVPGNLAKPIEVGGRSWPSQAACADALGVTAAAVSVAIRRGKLADLVARHLPGAKVEGVSDAA